MSWARKLTETREQREERLQSPRPAPAVGSLHRGVYAPVCAKPAPAIAKECASQHQGYMAAVRALGYCMHCRRACRPQFCHRDQGKGERIKTDVREGWPGCAECHHLVGSTGFYPKEERRALELELGRRTREAVKAAGTWPAHLPMWSKA